MIGTNEISLCRAEMFRAIEEYLRSRMTPEYGKGIKVTAVRIGEEYGSSGIFVITVQGGEESKEATP